MSEGTNSRIGRRALRVVAMGQMGNAPVIGDASRSNSNEPWVKYGRSNLFPEFVRALADNCAPLDACVVTMAQYIAGEGFSFEDLEGNPIKAAHSKWEELCGEDGPDALLHALALDTALLSPHSLEVIFSRSGQPLELNHIDVCRVRSGKKDQEGRVNEFYFSSNWEKRTQEGYKPVPIPAWGTKGAGNVLIYKKGYKQLRDYYGEPHWLAVMADAEVLARIPVFNRTQIDTGFRPAVHAHLQTQRDGADVEQIDEDFEMVFTGDSGKTHILTVGAVNETLTINKLERGDHAGELDATRKVSKEEIFHSYGIPPILMGVDANTGLSGKGLAISETLSMFQTTKVAPKQKPLCHTAKMILATCGIEVPVVRIKHLVPFEPAQDPALVRQTYLRSRNVGEDRLKTGMPVLTTDGMDPKEDRSNWDPWMLKPLIEVGMKANTNEEQDANRSTNEDEQDA